jgi:hypothetical protein
MLFFGNRDMIDQGETRMNLMLNLTPETEAKLKAEAALCGKSLEQLALEAIDDKLSDRAKVGRRLSKQERIKLFNEWIASQPVVSNFVDDSRERIYEGRGE